MQSLHDSGWLAEFLVTEAEWVYAKDTGFLGVTQFAPSG